MIYEFLIKKGKFVYKSEFEEIGIDVHSMEKWIELIQFIQKQPQLIVRRLGRYTMVGLESFFEEAESGN